ncbi:MAG: alpha/beta fold hydrolase [Actinobacteria bacterium]|nr:alpha/beta fold hydrolase [Actinomycetota bacterium]
MTAAAVNGITIEYEEHGPGDGEPVLLVMGLGAQLVLWPPAFIDALVASGHRVITFDNRDVGRSSRIDAPAPSVADLARALVARRSRSAPYSLADMADDAAALLDHLGIARTHVVGASMGGMIAQELAIRHPAKVATLTSIMSNTGERKYRHPSPALLPALLRVRSAEPGDTETGIEVARLISGPEFDEAAAREIEAVEVSRGGDPAEAMAGVARQTLAVLNSRDRTDDLRRLRVPTLVVHGLLDRLVRPVAGMATARAVPGARLVMYPDMAHDMPASRIPELTDEVLVHLARSPITAREAALASG